MTSVGTVRSNVLAQAVGESVTVTLIQIHPALATRNRFLVRRTEITGTGGSEHGYVDKVTALRVYNFLAEVHADAEPLATMPALI
jgi:hypothetical protein